MVVTAAATTCLMQLELQETSVRYPNLARPVVESVSLSLAAGDIGVLLGPSGSGKTTLLRAVAGLEPLTHGSIRLGERVLSTASLTLAPEQRRMGMVFQDYALFPHLSVSENVAFGLNALSRSAQRARVAEMLQLVGLAEQAARYPHQLSGGQQQRVALARALAPKPQLLLLDEPFSNLDVHLREHLAQELRQILKTANTTALLVTHDQLEAFAIGDRVGVLHQGQLHQWSAPQTLYQHPASPFVAQFVGQGALVAVQLAQNSDGTCTLNTPLGAQACDSQAKAPAGNARLLLRPTDVLCDSAATTQATVLRQTFCGDSYLYTLALPDGEQIQMRSSSAHQHPPGSIVGIRYASEQQPVLFPAA